MSEALAADRRLHPASFGIRFVKTIPEFVVGFPAVVAFSADAGAPLVFTLVAIGAAAALGAALISWMRFRYGVGERDFVIESGVFQRQRRVIPFDRVQDIDIEQGLLARLFGTVTVRIETGGAGRDEGRLEAVSRIEAQRLRDIIRSRGAAADAAPAAMPEEPLLFELKLPRLLIAGLFNFSLLYLAVLGAAFENLQPFFGWDPFDPDLLLGPDVAGQVTIARTLILLAALLSLGIVTGIVHTTVKNYGFRLTRSGSGLRRVRGLLTRTEIVIPFRRIQVALLRTGLVSGAMGLRSLDYQTLSGDAVQSGGQAAAPFARMAEIEPILRETGHADLPPSDAYVRVSRLSVARGLLRYLLPVIPAAVALSFFTRAAPLLILLIPFLVGIAVLQWKRHRYALTDGHLIVAQGLFERRLWIVPFERAQTLSISRSPLQRALGLASVTVDTAGAGLIHYPLIVDLDADDANRLGARLLDLHKAARSGLSLRTAR